MFTAATARIRPSYALPAMVVGSTIFLQAHLVLGYLLGPLADQALNRARLPFLIAVGVLVVGGLLLWTVRRKSGGSGGQAWTEACCPACLAVALITPSTGRQETA